MRRMTTRPALGPCVSFKLDEDTHLKLVNAKERSGRSKAGEVVLRVKDHLLRYPDFYPTVTYKSVSFGPVVMARFDEDTNKKRHCCKVSDEAAFCLIQRPYISKTLLTRRISPRGSP